MVGRGGVGGEFGGGSRGREVAGSRECMTVDVSTRREAEERQSSFIWSVNEGVPGVRVFYLVVRSKLTASGPVSSIWSKRPWCCSISGLFSYARRCFLSFASRLFLLTMPPICLPTYTENTNPHGCRW